MKRILPFLLVFLSATCCIAQTRKIDSLKSLIRIAADSRVKLKLILALCDQHESLPTDTAWSYALKARSLASKLHDDIAQSRAKIAQASAYLQWNNPDSARALLKPEIAKYRVENAATRHLYFKLLQKEIDCSDQDSYFKDGYARVFSIMRLAERYKDSVVIAESMNTLGAWNYDMDFVDRSTAWEYKGIAYCSVKTPKFYEALAGLYLNLAGNYNWINKRDSAAYFTRKSIQLSEQSQNLLMLSYAWETTANTYKAQKDYRRAEEAELKSAAITKRIYGDVPQQRQIMTLASIYRFSGRSDKAIRILRDGLIADSLYNYHSPHSPKKVGSKDLQLIFYYEELARNYSIQKDYKNLSAMQARIIKGKDSLYSANSAQAMADMGMKYESQKKEATIARQRLALIKQHYLLYGSVLFVVLAGVIVWLIIKDLRRKHKLRLQLLQEEEKRMVLQAVAEAEDTERRRIAADLHDNLGAQLSFIKRNVNFVIEQPEGFSGEDEQRYLTFIKDTAQDAMMDLRETIWVLNKSEVFVQEFADKLKSYLHQQLAGKNDVKWDFKEQVTDNWELTSGEVMHLFRIMQELVNNILKHAEADRILIDFSTSRPDSYNFQIMDNGKGFDIGKVYDGHYGMKIIRRRAKDIGAEVMMESEPGKGVKITITKDRSP